MATISGTILLTGANGGLGSAIVKNLVSSADAAASLHSVYTVRNVDTAANLKSILAYAKPSHKHEEMALDLSRLSDVRDFAAIINKRVADNSLPRIRALILNAGYQEHTTHAFTADGFDMSFQCNYLSHWLLVLMLLQSMDLEFGRIVVVGSFTHDPNDHRNDSMGFYKGGNWKTVFHDTDSIAKGTWSSTKDDPTMSAGFRRYGASKLCEIMMIYELQRRLDADPVLSNISVLGVDPGGMPTGLLRRGNFVMSVLAAKILVPIMASIQVRLSPNGPLRTTTKSACDVLRVAFDTEALDVRPKAAYFNGTELSDTSSEAKDQIKQGILWRDSVKYTGLKAGDTTLTAWN